MLISEESYPVDDKMVHIELRRVKGEPDQGFYFTYSIKDSDTFKEVANGIAPNLVEVKIRAKAKLVELGVLFLIEKRKAVII
jgi:hypothetical protein